MADKQLPDILKQVHELPVSEEKREQLFNAFYSDTPRSSFEAIKDVPLEIKQAMFGIRGKINRGEQYDVEEITRVAPGKTAAIPKDSAIAEMSPEKLQIEMAKDRRAAVQSRALDLAKVPTVFKKGSDLVEKPDFFGRSSRYALPSETLVTESESKPEVVIAAKEAAAKREAVPAQKPKAVPDKVTAPPPKTEPPPKSESKPESKPEPKPDFKKGTAKDGPYITRLSQEEQGRFLDWVIKNNVPFDPNPNADYDMPGFWKAQQNGDPRAVTEVKPDGLHFTDTFKTPFHKTFSSESIYAGPDAPRWKGEKLYDVKGKLLQDESGTKPPPSLSAKPTLATAPPPKMPSIPVVKPSIEEVDSPGLLLDIARGLGRGALSTTTSAIQALTRIPGGLRDQLINLEIGKSRKESGKEEPIIYSKDGKSVAPSEVVENARKKVTQGLRNKEETLKPTAPVSGVGKFGESVGSTAPFMVMESALGKPGTAAFGALASIEESLRRLEDSGIEITDTQKAGLVAASALLGSSEALPAERLIGHFKRTGVISSGISAKSLMTSLFPSLKEYAKSGAKQFALEGGQELSTDLGQDILETLYGGRTAGKIGENSLEAFNEGGKVGFFLDVLTKLAGSSLGRSRLRNSGVKVTKFKKFLADGDQTREFADPEYAVDEFLKLPSNNPAAATAKGRATVDSPAGDTVDAVAATPAAAENLIAPSVDTEPTVVGTQPSTQIVEPPSQVIPSLTAPPPTAQKLQQVTITTEDGSSSRVAMPDDLAQKYKSITDAKDKSFAAGILTQVKNSTPEELNQAILEMSDPDFFNSLSKADVDPDFFGGDIDATKVFFKDFLLPYLKHEQIQQLSTAPPPSLTPTTQAAATAPDPQSLASSTAPPPSVAPPSAPSTAQPSATAQPTAIPTTPAQAQSPSPSSQTPPSVVPAVSTAPTVATAPVAPSAPNAPAAPTAPVAPTAPAAPTSPLPSTANPPVTPLSTVAPSATAPIQATATPATAPSTQQAPVSPLPHPKLDDAGQQVIISSPSTQTADTTWSDPASTAVFTPEGNAPNKIGNIEVKPFTPPQGIWSKISGVNERLEARKPFTPNPQKASAAGVIIVEDDGRVWLVSPTNQFGGYDNTFPKGKVEQSLTMQENAIKEAWEETGLKVDIIGVVGDYERSTSKARYYLAVRTGGTPNGMGWESQAVKLTTLQEAKSLLNQNVDKGIIDDLEKMISSGKLAEVKDGTPRKLSSYGTELSTKSGGSNPGGWYQDGSTKVLVKGNKQKVIGSVTSEESDNRASNEVLASKLIQAFSKIGAPDMKLVNLEGKYGGGLGVASKNVPSFKDFNVSDPSHVKAAMKDFAVHAWLANYDVLGMGYDNTVIAPDGSAINIDPGGALLFRAQGLPKGQQHGVLNGRLDTSAPEFESMQITTPEQKAVFGKMTSDQLKESAQTLSNITDEKIRKLVNTYGFGTDEYKDSLTQDLIDRRDAILGKVGLPPVVASPTAQSTTAATTTAPPPVTPPATQSAAQTTAPPPTSQANSSTQALDFGYSFPAIVPDSVAQAINQDPNFNKFDFIASSRYYIDNIASEASHGYDPVYFIDDIISHISPNDLTSQKGVLPYLEYLKNELTGKSTTYEIKDTLDIAGQSFGKPPGWINGYTWSNPSPVAPPATQTVATPTPSVATQTSPPTTQTTAPPPTSQVSSLDFGYHYGPATVPDSVAQAYNKDPDFEKSGFIASSRFYIYNIASEASQGIDPVTFVDDIISNISPSDLTSQKGVLPYFEYLRDELTGKSTAEVKDILDKAGQSFGKLPGWINTFTWASPAIVAPPATQTVATPTPSVATQTSPPTTQTTAPPPTSQVSSLDLGYNSPVTVPDSVAQAYNQDPNFDKGDFTVLSKYYINLIAYDISMGMDPVASVDDAMSFFDPSKLTSQKGTLPYFSYIKNKLTGKSITEVKDILGEAGESFGKSPGWISMYPWPSPAIVAPPATQTATPPSPSVATQAPPSVQQQSSQSLTSSQTAAAAASAYLSGTPTSLKDLSVYGDSVSIPDFAMQSYQAQTSDNQSSFVKRLYSLTNGTINVADLLAESQSKLASYKASIQGGTSSQFTIDRVKYFEDLLIPYLEYSNTTGTSPVKIAYQTSPSSQPASSNQSGIAASLPPGVLPQKPAWALTFASTGASVMPKSKPIKDKIDALNYYAFANYIYGETNPVTKKAMQRLTALQKTQGAIDNSVIESAKQDASSKYSTVQLAYKNADPDWAPTIFKYTETPNDFKFAWKGTNSTPEQKKQYDKFVKYQNKAIKGKLSQAELSSIGYYKGHGHHSVNEALADNVINGIPIPPGPLDHIKRIDEALSKITLGSDMLLKRAVPSHFFWAQYGYAHGTNPSDSELQSWIGQTYKELGLVSTSVDPSWDSTYGVAPYGKVVMKIKANKNNHGIKVFGAPINGSNSEMEVLFPRNISFVIHSIKKGVNNWGGGKVWNIEVELVDQSK